MNIKKGDTVKILAGKDKGKTGPVLEVLSARGRVIVEKLNLVKKHSRPKKQGQKGQIIDIPRSVDISNAQLICSKCKKASRVGFKMENDKKVRYCKKCNASI